MSLFSRGSGKMKMLQGPQWHLLTSLAGATLIAVAVSTAGAAINLELRPGDQSVSIGDTVEVGLYVVSDDGANQLTAAMQVILSWNPDHLQLLGNHSDGAVALLTSVFPAGDPYGLNEVVPPQDGDGLFIAFAPLANPVAATPEGTLITTFEFLAMAPAWGTPVDMPDTGGAPPVSTIVFDGTVPNLDVTGTITGAAVEVLSCCTADLDGDCVVGIEDFLALLAAWGTDPGGPPDLDDDGSVGINDFLGLLAAWGPCP